MDNGENSYRRFLAGDTSGFDELIYMYREPLINFINGYLHNLAESEEVAEDSFLELIVHPKRYNFRSSLKTYIFSVAHHKAIDRIRRETRISREPIESLSEENERSLEEILFEKERNEQLHRAMDKINREYAAALRLIYFEGMTGEEAARVLGKSKRQMANITYRAKIALKKAMEEEGFYYEK